MEISIKNCNNILDGKFDIIEKRLNIKFAINGTGKSTISKALRAFVNDDEAGKDALLPFKYYAEPENNSPCLYGYESIKNLMVFNEEYISEYMFRPTELIKNSFEIFIKTENYDKHLKEIEELLKDIRNTFQEHSELNELIEVFQKFVDGFGKSKKGYSAAGGIGKGLGKGNKIANIPKGLEVYAPYLQGNDNVKWIKWQLDGKKYLDIADQCPYCSGSVKETKGTILKVSEEYDVKYIEHLDKMLEVFDTLSPYFSQKTMEQIEFISQNVAGITSSQQNYLLEIKRQVIELQKQLIDLKNIGFYSLKNSEKIADELNKYVIDLSYYSHLQSPLSKEKVNIINDALQGVLIKAGQLQGAIAKQKKEVKKTINMYSDEINNFLHYAGYNYQVVIEESQEADKYHLILKYIEGAGTIQDVNEHLSYGERNAFALVLFMYSALRNNPDLIILDDPISSFDGNKRFAIINMLFMGKHCLRDKTVLLLTHEFNTVIDIIYNLPHKFNLKPQAYFLTTKKGILEEKRIAKDDIKSFSKITEDNLSLDIDSLNKLVYLRRLLEIRGKGIAWQLISNIFHKREIPQYQISHGETRKMTSEEIQNATQQIRKMGITNFDYATEYQKTQDRKILKDLYTNSRSNYEKLQIYRIMFPENHPNEVIKKFINEIYHVENDYLFQLDPSKYDTVPQYIIDECDKEVLE